MTEICLRAQVLGRVQGVGFRAFVVDNAEFLGLEGWVRNMRDGAVEMLLAGPEERVFALLEHCKEGPPLAEVTGVEAAPEQRPADLHGFRRAV
ncbi:acylphosphatase [Rhodovulum sp. DZ06]|uniref:acylphosphatase n=1 Tax=Rhodovulum sp. DZ06 TaxID=3425126 RepID=UPI003D33F362